MAEVAHDARCVYLGGSEDGRESLTGAEALALGERLIAAGKAHLAARAEVLATCERDGHIWAEGFDDYEPPLSWTAGQDSGPERMFHVAKPAAGNTSTRRKPTSGRSATQQCRSTATAPDAQTARLRSSPAC